MVFEIQGKIALVSGGASGLGLEFAKHLLRSGLKGVTLADINNQLGQKAIKEIEQEFGPNKAVYVETDVTDKQSYEEAFKETIRVFKHLDILINNAGVMNDSIWEKEIAININGVVNGILLGLENYIPKYRTGSEGVIVNLSSIAGVHPFMTFPVYVATKFAVMGMSQAFGHKAHFERTKVKVLALCPGATTDTALILDYPRHTLGTQYSDFLEADIGSLPRQKPESVAVAMVEIVKSAETGTVWVVEGAKDPYQFVLPKRETFTC